MTRFAIGVEGGFDANAGDFDVETEEHYQIVLVPGFHAIPFPNANLPDMVNELTISLIFDNFIQFICIFHPIAHRSPQQSTQY